MDERRLALKSEANKGGGVCVAFFQKHRPFSIERSRRMQEIRKLTDAEIPQFVDIMVNAYPGLIENASEVKDKYTNILVEQQNKENSIDVIGLFRDQKLLGGMRLHPFTMNVYSKLLQVGGVGSVAVDLLHKKERVAKQLIQSFLDYYRTKNVSVVLLYPFRPDFYRKMGFGYGTKKHQYLIEPASFPNQATPDGLVYLKYEDRKDLQDCFNRYAQKTHGMLLKSDHEVEMVFKNRDLRLVGFRNGEQLEGYIVFSFKKMSETNFNKLYLIVKEFIYETPLALAKLCSFLHRQADQIERIEINTQDEYFEHLLHDARNGTDYLIPSVFHETNTSGTGIMYRIIDVETFFYEMREHVFGRETCTIQLVVNDSFLPENEQTVILQVKDGYISVGETVPVDVEMELDISDLSSLLLGSVDAKSLYTFGRMKLSDPTKLDMLHRLFFPFERPVCMTAF